MADHADTAERPQATDDDVRVTTRAGTDRQSAGRSVATTPESLYLSQIAVLEWRVDALQRRVAQRERDLQHVVDRYEAVLDERAARERELLTDGGNSTSRAGGPPDRDAIPGRALAALRSLVE